MYSYFISTDFIYSVNKKEFNLYVVLVNWYFLLKFLVFLFVGFHMQIAVYIGVQRLVQQLLIVLAILGVLLISYFISTWVLFNKSASA